MSHRPENLFFHDPVMDLQLLIRVQKYPDEKTEILPTLILEGYAELSQTLQMIVINHVDCILCATVL